jgi:hypothetical protein
MGFFNQMGWDWTVMRFLKNFVPFFWTGWEWPKNQSRSCLQQRFETEFLQAKKSLDHVQNYISASRERLSWGSKLSFYGPKKVLSMFKTTFRQAEKDLIGVQNWVSVCQESLNGGSKQSRHVLRKFQRGFKAESQRAKNGLAEFKTELPDSWFWIWLC